MPPAPQQNRLRWDGTINAGHLLTTACLIIAFISGWMKLEARVGEQEVRLDAMNQTATIVTQYTDRRLKQQEDATKAALLEIKRQLERIEDKIDRKVDR
jgi:hypothetical protein